MGFAGGFLLGTSSALHTLVPSTLATLIAPLPVTGCRSHVFLCAVIVLLRLGFGASSTLVVKRVTERCLKPVRVLGDARITCGHALMALLLNPHTRRYCCCFAHAHL